MRPQNPRSARTDKGFTLIELLVVIVIVGILAAIAIPMFLSQRQKAFDATAKSDASSLAIQVESFYTDDLTYPGDADFDLAGPQVLIGGEVVRMSPGNVPAVHVAGNAFCVSVANPGKATRSWVWQSDNGGLQSDGTQNCSAYGSALS
ncbi:MAG: type IV pilin protein [Sporichthyaceae bacterium]